MEYRQSENCVGGGHNGDLFETIISLENLFSAWREFVRGKASRRDVQAFWLQLEDNIFSLHEDLSAGKYRHGPYESFFVSDPKRRHIHKASVRDRLLHQAIVRVIEPLFDRTFIFDSWSCRKGKGTHRAVERFQKLAWALSRNNTKTVWVFKLDIRKYFASVDHDILRAALAGRIFDGRTRNLLTEIIRSFSPGIPLGNLTSQLFANVYLNELDQFIKHTLRLRVYLRYCDDFLLAHRDRTTLLQAFPAIRSFLRDRLRLSPHPDKIALLPYHRGVDFLGFVCFLHFRILRTATERRLIQRYSAVNAASYYGLLKYAKSYTIVKQLSRRYRYARRTPAITGVSHCST